MGRDTIGMGHQWTGASILMLIVELGLNRTNMRRGIKIRYLQNDVR